MKLERSFIETEDDGRLNWDFNGQTQVIVVNQNETNKYGEYRGYRSKSVNSSYRAGLIRSNEDTH
jgi:hypothetical protein